jgi:hypothetical protein
LIDSSDIDFLYWLKQRLIYLHGYTTDNKSVSRLNLLITKLKDNTIQLSTLEIDKIISQYFVDFNLTKDGTLNIGYTDEERDRLRNDIMSIAIDFYKQNVPKETLIK